MKHRPSYLIFTIVFITMSIFDTTVAQDWITLFNGEDLSGWEVKCTPEDGEKVFWTVRDGAIEANSMNRPDHDYIWLIHEDEFSDFELRLQFQAFRDSPGNSGVQVRSRFDESPDAPRGGWMNGPQADINPPTPWRTGLIYDETWGERRWIYPSLEDWNIDKSYAPDKWKFKFADQGDGWNDFRIICNGTSIETYLNGLQMADLDGRGLLTNEAHEKFNVGLIGHIALQLHSGDELKIRFKNIKLRKLN